MRGWEGRKMYRSLPGSRSRGPQTLQSGVGEGLKEVRAQGAVPVVGHPGCAR